MGLLEDRPEVQNQTHHSKVDADGSIQMKTNHLKADADGYLQAMTMNGWSQMLHSEENQSFLLDQMIDEATEVLANKAEPFKQNKNNTENFVATQAEIDAMVSNIPTPKSKHNKN